MAVRDPEQARTRSALRYRPLATDDQASPAPTVSRARRTRPDARMRVAPAVPDELERAPGHRTSAPAPRRSTPPTGIKRRTHPLLFMGLGLVVAVLLWVGVSWLVNWGTNEYNTIVYGYPRTFQVDAVVGQGDSPQNPSHFLAINWHGQVSILEFPAGDPSKVRVLATITIPGPNADQTVATLTFIDINHNGKPDLLINCGGIENVLINDGTTFRPPTATEQQQVLQVIEHQH